MIESVLDTDPVKPMREMNSAWLASPQERRTTFLAQRTKEPGYVEAYNILQPINASLGHIMLDEIDIDTVLKD